MLPAVKSLKSSLSHRAAPRSTNFFRRNATFALGRRCINDLFSLQLPQQVIHKIFIPAADLGYDIRRSDLPARTQAAFSSWEGPSNPGYSVRFWNERSVRSFLRDEYGQQLLDVFDQIIPEAWRVNLARFSIVARFGGWYTDVQTILLRGLDEEFSR